MVKQLQACQYILAATPWASATTERTAALDTSTFGADSVTLVVPIGIQANTNSTGTIVTVSSSDDTVVTNHATIGSTTYVSTAAGGVAIHVNVVRKRYLRLVATPDTTTNGAVLIGGVVAVVNPEVRGLTQSTTMTVVNIV